MSNEPGGGVKQFKRAWTRGVPSTLVTPLQSPARRAAETSECQSRITTQKKKCHLLFSIFFAITCTGDSKYYSIGVGLALTICKQNRRKRNEQKRNFGFCRRFFFFYVKSTKLVFSVGIAFRSGVFRSVRRKQNKITVVKKSEFNGNGETGFKYNIIKTFRDTNKCRFKITHQRVMVDGGGDGCASNVIRPPKVVASPTSWCASTNKPITIFIKRPGPRPADVTGSLLAFTVVRVYSRTRLGA